MDARPEVAGLADHRRPRRPLHRRLDLSLRRCQRPLDHLQHDRIDAHVAPLFADMIHRARIIYRCQGGQRCQRCPFRRPRMPEHEPFVGRALKRTEDPRLIRGEGQYVDDLQFPGLTHLAFLRSPHAHARVVAIRTEAARKAPGVLAVVTAGDLPELRPTPYMAVLPGLKAWPYQAIAERIVDATG